MMIKEILIITLITFYISQVKSASFINNEELGPTVIESTEKYQEDQEKNDVLKLNSCLYKGNQLKSNNGQFQLIMQEDGNLVTYKTLDNRPTWSSKTDRTSADHACMTENGNFVILNKDQEKLWSTETGGKGHFIIMQNDGNLVVYSQTDEPVWASSSAPKINILIE